MERKIRILITLLISVLMFNFVGMNCYANGSIRVANLTEKENQDNSKNIVDIATGDARFKTLVTALKAAELVDALKEPGPFTVFAPTDEAFAKIPKDKLDELLKPENKEKLARILTYHVAPEKLTAKDVSTLDGKPITMLNGKKAKVEVRNGEVYIDGAKVISTDIMAGNGVIHVIDTVIMP